jgi:hypothetical protein
MYSLAIQYAAGIPHLKLSLSLQLSKLATASHCPGSFGSHGVSANAITAMVADIP